MQSTATSERIHIAIFGRCNAGKSTLANRIIGQDIAIVSDTKGTTTDPVQKALEINGLGAAIIIDTPGIDDDTTLGKERVARINKVMDKADIAIVLFTEEPSKAELHLIKECRTREIPIIAALAQADRLTDRPTLQATLIAN